MTALNVRKSIASNILSVLGIGSIEPAVTASRPVSSMSSRSQSRVEVPKEGMFPLPYLG